MLPSSTKDKKQLFKQLFNEYSKEIYKATYYFCKNKYYAEEILQDTFVAAYTKIDSLEDFSKLKSWLISIALNNAKAKLKNLNKIIFFPTLREYETYYSSDKTNTHDINDIIEYNELKDYLQQKISLLEPEFKEVIILYYYNELSYLEISEKLRIHIGTVKSRLARAKIKLKKLLNDDSETVLD